MKKSKVMKFTYQITRRITSDGEAIEVNLKLAPKLKNLMKYFVVLSAPSVPWRNPYGMSNSEGELQRYKIKSVVFNTSMWREVFVLFFTKKVIDTGNLTFLVKNIDNYQRLKSELSYFGDVLRGLYQLRNPEKIVHIINIGVEQ